MEWQLPRGHDPLLRTAVCAFGGPLPKLIHRGIRGWSNVRPASRRTRERRTDVPYKALPAILEGKVLSRHPALASIPLAGGKLTLRVGSRKWIEPS